LSGESNRSDLTNRYHLRLFVAGNTARSLRAISNLNRLCAEYLPDGCDLDVVDIYQQPELATRDQIVAAPTLLKIAPGPLRRIIGDLTDRPRVMLALGLAHQSSDDDGR
jgi:circadian clock protein KaiB